jgi:hypothetical protein
MSSAAFQLAVWEIVYENVSGFNLLSNAFHVTDDNGNAAAVAQANILLANMPALSLYTVTLLHSEDEQDFIFATQRHRCWCLNHLRCLSLHWGWLQWSWPYGVAAGLHLHATDSESNRNHSVIRVHSSAFDT